MKEGASPCDKIKTYEGEQKGTEVPGKAGKLMEVYPSDLSDDEWAILEPLIPPEKPGGRSREVDMRSGCAWRMLPREYSRAPRSMAILPNFAMRESGTRS